MQKNQQILKSNIQTTTTQPISNIILNNQIEKPKTIDLNILLKEREKILENNLKMKFEEYQKLLQNPNCDKKKILIQMQGIKLYNVQKKKLDQK